MRMQISLSKKPTDWFNLLSETEQKEYFVAHPKSKQKLMAHKTDLPKRAAKPAPATGATANEATMMTEKGRVMRDGSPLPPHIEALKLPPGWSNVSISSDPNAALQAVGYDIKGRRQSVYSEAFSKTQAEAKFRRVEELVKKFNSVSRQNDDIRASGDPKTIEAADCLKLIMTTGIRPGSETDTGAKEKAYGATTLEGRHIVKTDTGVELNFVGKKGVTLKIPVTDKDTVAMLLKRASESGPNGKLFATSDKKLLDHTHTMDGGGFKTKDFRTCLATKSAIAHMTKIDQPKNMKEYKKAVMDVAKAVSAKLGNTPTVALQSYINPVVFSQWQAGMPLESEAAPAEVKK